MYVLHRLILRNAYTSPLKISNIEYESIQKCGSAETVHDTLKDFQHKNDNSVLTNVQYSVILKHTLDQPNHSVLRNLS